MAKRGRPPKKTKTFSSFEWLKKQWKWLVAGGGFVAAIVLYDNITSGINNTLQINDRISSKSAVKDSNLIVCNFPKKFQKDTLYILVTRFEDDILEVESDCYGESLKSSIAKIAFQKKIPIQVCYDKNIVIRDDLKKASQVQKQYNADLVLYGTIRNIEKSCSSGNICFNSEPSDSLIHLAGGDMSLRKFDTNYEQNLSPIQLEQGQFHVNDKRFYDWLFVFYNTKIGEFSPDLYAIDENLEPKKKAKEYFEKAKLFYNLGKNAKAIENLNISIKNNPQNALAFGFRGTSFLEKNEVEKALSDFNKALKIDDKYAIVYNNRGAIKLQKGDLKGALSDYNEAIVLSPDNAVAYCCRAFVKQKLIDIKGALVDFEQAIKLDSKSIKIWIGRGTLKFELKDYYGAIYDYTKALELNPNNGSILVERATARHQNKDFSGAINDYNKAIELNPKDFEVYVFRGLSKERKNDNYGAINDYNKAIELNPKDTFALNTEANLKIKLNDFKGAIYLFSKIIELHPKNATTYHSRGLMYGLSKDYNFALNDFKQAIELEPKNGNFYNSRAAIFQKIGRRNEAKKDFKQAKKLGLILSKSK